MAEALTEGLPTAQARCTDLARHHYENFPVGSRWVRADLRPHVHAVYAFARTADDFADEPEFEGERLERLADWRRRLGEAEQGRAGDPVFEALAETIATFKLPVKWLHDLISAFELDVRKSRHATFDSLIEYAKLSANPVGRLVLWMHGYRDEERLELSDAFCTGLQLANFWQDVAVDWKKDRIYLPQEDLARFGVTEADLAGGVVDARFARLLDLEIGRTRKFFMQARPLCNSVGRDLRMELRLTWLGGARILRSIERNGYDVFRRRPKLGYRDKGWMLVRSLAWGAEA